MKRTIQIAIALLCASSIPMQANWEGLKASFHNNKPVIGFTLALDAIALLSAYGSYKCNQKLNTVTKEEVEASQNPSGKPAQSSRLSSDKLRSLSSIFGTVAVGTGIWGGLLTLVGLENGYRCLTDSRNWFEGLQK